MSSKRRYEGLLIRYLLQELDAEETMQVQQWLNESGSNSKYFDQLKKTLALTTLKDADSNIDINEQWNSFKQALTETDIDKYLDTEPFEEDLPYAETDKGRFRKKHIRAILAVAASILFPLCLWWGLFNHNNDNEISRQAIKTQNVSRKDSSKSVLRHEINESNTAKNIVLQDGSSIMLEEKTEVRFMEPFQGKGRNITLTGKAYFKVAKDKSKPFIVSSGDISTTVLGTRFIVSAYAFKRHISVKLFEGSVVVKSGDTVKQKLKRHFYLLPGQVFVYDKLNATAKIIRFNLNKDVELKSDENAIPDDPSISLSTKSSWYMFNNQMLSDVFEQLKAVYKVDIIYNKKDVEKMYFIGKFNKSDSLKIIMQEICILNNLKMITRDNTYFISK